MKGNKFNSLVPQSHHSTQVIKMSWLVSFKGNQFQQIGRLNALRGQKEFVVLGKQLAMATYPMVPFGNKILFRRVLFKLS
jgi:hypothetical protein